MEKRKSISKKTRFEVFKRDEFSCSYCGKKPPHVTLEVDHIIPVSRNGGNGIDNLITACFDCNRGKSDIPLTSIPESLSDKAARIKEAESQLRALRKMAAMKEQRIEDDAWSVVHALYGDEKNEIRRDWFLSIKRFNERLDLADVIRAAEIAATKKAHASDSRFKYFCGICWAMIKETQDA